tara:strand:+ start:1173 stop:1388 length:216 start_codon:yes stop_codon:yes gene_type:complete
LVYHYHHLLHLQQKLLLKIWMKYQYLLGQKLILLHLLLLLLHSLVKIMLILFPQEKMYDTHLLRLLHPLLY